MADYLKNIKRYLIGLFFFIIILLFLGFILWVRQDSKYLNLLIVNKTVPDILRNEHKSLIWILSHHKIRKSNNKHYSLSEDYYGFYPVNLKEDNFEIRNIPFPKIIQLTDTYDMVYYVDTYGVYLDKQYNYTQHIQPATKLFGGLGNNDVWLMKEMKYLNKLILTEFSILEPPSEEKIRKELSELLNISWKGWIGKYFEELDINMENRLVPGWIVQYYENHNNHDWKYKGAGIVLIHESGNVVVLDRARYLVYEAPLIETDEIMAEFYDLPESVPFSKWFDVVDKTDSMMTISNFKLKVNQKGDSLLQENDISPEFPAVIKDMNKRFYYFAGDFSHSNIDQVSSYFNGFAEINQLLRSEKRIGDRNFFWNYYLPLLETIILDYYDSVQQLKEDSPNYVE